MTQTGPGRKRQDPLALQAAAAAADDYDHGVWWVPLSSLADPALVATRRRLRRSAPKTRCRQRWATSGCCSCSTTSSICVDAAADVAETIGACPNLTVLVTSREPLHIDGEWEVAVDPLREREAVELFVQRAAAVRSDFAANGEVAEICRRLDCLPLAIELAAARVKALSLPALLQRLEQRLPLLAGGSRSAPERQRTLRATITWSYELLTPVEQDTFAQLAVFAGGCTLEAAEEICGADVDAIASLVDKSLLRHSGDRYWLLQTIREFAGPLLDESGEGDDGATGTPSITARSQSSHMRSGWSPKQAGCAGSTASKTICAQRSTTCKTATPLEYLRLASALGWYWEGRAPYEEASRRLEEAVASADEDGALTARALVYLGSMDAARGQYSLALSRLEKAIEFWRAVGNQMQLLDARLKLGWALYRAERSRGRSGSSSRTSSSRVTSVTIRCSALRSKASVSCSWRRGSSSARSRWRRSFRVTTTSPTALSTGVTTPPPSSTG